MEGIRRIGWRGLALVFAAALSACTKGSGSSSSLGPPGALQYAVNPVTYAAGTPITPDTLVSAASGGSFAVTPALPSGLSLDPSSGTISGTPASAQSQAQYVVTQTNSYGSNFALLTITVAMQAPAISYPGAPVVDSENVASTPLAPTSSGGAISSCSVAPALPAGLGLSSGCVLSGTPTKLAAAADYVVTATNAGGSSSATLNLAVVAGPAAKLVFSTEPGASAQAGVALGTQPVVQVQDAYGNVVSAASNAVRLAAFTDSACSSAAWGSLSAGANPLSASDGSANFSGVSYRGGPGAIYLGASSPGLSAACSSAVAVSSTQLASIAADPMGLYTCAVSQSGNVYCWGENSKGQLGNGSTTNEKTPVEVLGVGGSGELSGIVSIAAGADHSCALSSSGNVYCWGENNDGQLGNGSTTNEKTPVEVLGVGGSGDLSGIASIAAGADYSCALSSSGNVYCWGQNNHGQLGNGSTTNEKTPVEVLGVGGSGDLSGISWIAAGQFHTCAVSQSGNVDCWGRNNDGQLGNGSKTSEKTPVEVLGVSGSGALADIVGLALGASHSCAVSLAGAAFCWGEDSDGQLGNGSQENETSPVEVLGEEGSGGDLPGVVALAAGEDHTCAVSSSGNVYCWGANADGQLGDGSTESGELPIEVDGVGGEGELSGMIGIAAGESHSCAVSSSGEIDCWGDGKNGQLGNGSTNDETSPVEVPGVELPGVGGSS